MGQSIVITKVEIYMYTMGQSIMITKVEIYTIAIT